MARLDNILLAEAYYAAFSQGNVERCILLTQEDVELFFVPLGKRGWGREALHAFLMRWKRAAPDAWVEIEGQLVTAAGITNECLLRATHTGPLWTPDGPIPATFRPVELRFMELWRIREGLVSSIHSYTDCTTLLRQLGAFPPTSATSPSVE